MASFANATAASTGLAKLNQTPFYFQAQPAVIPGISDKYLSLALPILIYWLVSLFYHALDTLQLPFTERYRLHEPEEVTKRNRVSVSRVIVMVGVQQAIQTMLGLLLLDDDAVGFQQTFADHPAKILDIAAFLRSSTAKLLGPSLEPTATKLLFGGQDALSAAWWLYWWGIPTAQFWFAFFVMDAWQYTLHRLFHESRFLYRHFHSHHHRLYVPYAFGALYNHPVEGLLLDSAGAALSHAAALMTVRQSILLFTFSTVKTVADHGGYAFPWYLDPLHLVFPNCAEYHDVHHQMTGLRYNYSQPFFVHFDVLFGTRISADKFQKMKKLAEQKRAAEKESNLNGSAPAAAAATSTQLDGKDATPAEIVDKSSDPFVTKSKRSYAAKAGTATGE
ncbi:related to SUR2-sphingosine hydroxylase [Sporisorium reilianum f. sp. reilianum]|uniref:Related to SUR2-sphingosine hydroxylase n=1 Tax=Sporisorium reilianum f. sp. reilianum TaxID=72559 RepID=A0A2N8UA13_9BASI|nr:related to SUR2-sphingosine hydroxylase [Sporisorium reilianum f. sp. reilianum]